PPARRETGSDDGADACCSRSVSSGEVNRDVDVAGLSSPGVPWPPRLGWRCREMPSVRPERVRRRAEYGLVPAFFVGGLRWALKGVWQATDADRHRGVSGVPRTSRKVG